MSAILVKQVLQPVPIAPMSVNGNITDLEGIAAIILRNNGDSRVDLWHGKWSLQQYETISFNVTEDCFSTMEFLQVPVNFVGGTTNSLQIVFMKRKSPC